MKKTVKVIISVICVIAVAFAGIYFYAEYKALEEEKEIMEKINEQSKKYEDVDWGKMKDVDTEEIYQKTKELMESENSSKGQ